MLVGIAKKIVKRIIYGTITGGLKPVFDHVAYLNPFIKKGLTVVEVGSERGGGSTHTLAKFCQKHKLNLITIDPNKDTHRSAKRLLSKFNNKGFQAINAKGEEYLCSYNKGDILLAYLDGFDVVIREHTHKPSTIAAYQRQGIDLLKDGNKISAKVHLQATLCVEKNLVHGGMIAFDDSWHANEGWQGKGKTAIPYLIDQGFKLINSKERKRKSHSIVLQK